MTSLVLASGSAIRARLLRDVGVEFTAQPAEVDEDAIKTSMCGAEMGQRSPARWRRPKRCTSFAVYARKPFVLGADQILTFDGELVSKCADMAAARPLLCAGCVANAIG